MSHPAIPAVGIDLGTTFSVVARLDGSGNPRVIPNMEGDLSTPSIVYFHDGGVVVGKEAAKVSRYEPAAVRNLPSGTWARPPTTSQFWEIDFRPS